MTSDGLPHQVSSATHVLRAMEEGAAHPPNAYSYCIMMSAYGARNQLGNAERLWKLLWQQGWVDTVVLNCWLQACITNGEVQRALLAPSLWASACTCSRWRPLPSPHQVPRALQAFQTAKKELPSLQLDKVTFGTLINGQLSDVIASNDL